MQLQGIYIFENELTISKYCPLAPHIRKYLNKNKANCFMFCNSLLSFFFKTAEIGMTENIGDSGVKFEIWFRRRRPQVTRDTFVLQGATRSVKRAWVEEIRGLLLKQALRNKGKQVAVDLPINNQS